MAALTEFICSHCGFRLESWGEANPYLRGSDGKRHYYYHPGEREVWEERFLAENARPAATSAELTAFVEARCGCEINYLCMQCARQTQRDPQCDSLCCTDCKKRRLKDLRKLEGQTCPKCRQGVFRGEMTAIS